ncbi:TlpA disulfide reductase family protein [Aquimarina sp. AU474]|uniref:TlpA family protein disulfide reductase n=1 Tax=Aquimarina sp. AU474 TaxID=2108529 RepID=UPI000D6977E8|nr:TlpA disulfide reductase family protein [Aquimarina sp. AU474]
MKKVFKYLSIVLIALLGLGYVYIKYTTAEEGELAPDFETTLIDGSSFKLSDQKNKYVLLDFWGSWCAPCIKENPKIVKLYKKYPNKLTIVTLALEKDSLTWRKAAKRDGFEWKNQIVHQNKFVMLSPIARMYGVSEIPTKFLISPDGKLIGERTFEEIDQLLSNVILQKE